MWHAFLLLAEGDAAQPPPGGGTLSFLAPLLMVLVVFYFLMVRPQNKERDRLRQMIAGLKKNDRIVNAGGIIGTVDSIKDNDELVLKGGLHITKSSIVRILNADEVPKEEDK